MFWNKKNKSTPRSWEEITATKSSEISEQKGDVSLGDNEVNADEVSNSNNNKEHNGESAKNTKPAKKKSEKIDKMIENLELDPTIYYGWGEGKVDDAMRKATKVWSVMASIWWFLFGTITFAPILFIASKFDKFFNDKKKSFFISLILYVVTIIALILLILF